VSTIGPDGFTPLAGDVAAALRVIQKTADKQGSVTMLRLAENIANDAALVRIAMATAWDEAITEAEDRGLIPDVFADEARGRNPYRPESPADRGEGGSNSDWEPDDDGWHCAHEWLDRSESDTRECLICGVER
jgi:hypothetical protein